MTDLISRRALKNSLTNWQMEYAEKGKDVERFETLGAVIELVEQLPTIDPVKYGKWINEETCSVCGESVLYDTDLCNYCPNCGAKMDGGENEQIH